MNPLEFLLMTLGEIQVVAFLRLDYLSVKYRLEILLMTLLGDPGSCLSSTRLPECQSCLTLFNRASFRGGYPWGGGGYKGGFHGGGVGTCFIFIQREVYLYIYKRESLSLCM